MNVRIANRVGWILMVVALAWASDVSRKGFAKEGESAHTFAPEQPIPAADLDSAVEATGAALEDPAALARIARGVTGDPWRIAERALLLGKPEIANGLAGAKAHPRIAGLKKYLSQQSDTANLDTDAAASARIGAMIQKGNLDEAIAAIEVLKKPTVSSVLIRYYASRDLARKQRHADALKLIDAAIANAKSMKWSSGHEWVLGSKCELVRTLASPADQLKLATERAQLAKTLGTPSRLYQALRIEADAAAQGGLIEQAERAAYTLVRTSKKNGHVEVSNRALLMAATIQGRSGQSNKSIATIEKALRYFTASKAYSMVAKAYQLLSFAYIRSGNSKRALNYAQRALRVANEHRIEARLPGILNDLTAIYASVGETAKAIDHAEQALRHAVRQGARALEAATLINLGVLKSRTGDIQGASKAYQQGLKIAESLGDFRRALLAVNNLGVLAKRDGRFEEAIKHYKRAQVMATKVKDWSGLGMIYFNLGTLHQTQDKLKQAADYMRQSIEAYRKIDLRDGIARALAGLAEMEIRLEQLDKAATHAEDALDLAEDLGNVDLLVQVLQASAHVALRTKSYRPAARHLKRAYRESELMMKGLSDSGVSATKERGSQLNSLGVELSVATDDTDSGFVHIERGRAAALQASLHLGASLRDTLLPKALRDAEERARVELEGARKEYQVARKTGTRGTRKVAHEAMGEAEEALRGVINKIQREQRSESQLVFPQPDSLDVARGRLAKGQAYVLYARGGDSIHAIYVSQTKERIVTCCEASELAQLAKKLFSTEKGIIQPDIVDSLRASLVAPLKIESDVKHLLVGPMASMSFIPPSMLYDGLSANYIPSATTYGTLLEQETARGKGVLAIGNPDYSDHMYKLVALPNTATEVKAVGTKTLLGKEATETAFLKLLDPKKRLRALHFACHGLVDPVHPDRTGLALTNDDDNDGMLRTIEVFRLNQPADLAVLSACETGRGKVIPLEGIAGLTRAFMHSGVPRVLSSLWEVDDKATSALMQKFYELWNPPEGEGLPAHEALQKAQAFIRSNKKWEHPRYWAAWVLWGLP